MILKILHILRATQNLLHTKIWLKILKFKTHKKQKPKSKHTFLRSNFTRLDSTKSQISRVKSYINPPKSTKIYPKSRACSNFIHESSSYAIPAFCNASFAFLLYKSSCTHTHFGLCFSAMISFTTASNASLL